MTQRGRPSAKNFRPNPSKASATSDNNVASPQESGTIATPETEKEKIERIRAMREKRRSERKSLGALDGQRLVASKREGYYRRFMNDSPGRIDQMVDEGYDFVKPENAGAYSTDPGSKVSQVTGRDEHGKSQRTYLMEIPEEFVKENQDRRETQRSRIEKGVKSATHGGQALGKEKVGGKSVAYTPDNSHFETD